MAPVSSLLPLIGSRWTDRPSAGTVLIVGTATQYDEGSERRSFYDARTTVLDLPSSISPSLEPRFQIGPGTVFRVPDEDAGRRPDPSRRPGTALYELPFTWLEHRLVGFCGNL